jgi:hypothetical protein
LPPPGGLELARPVRQDIGIAPDFPYPRFTEIAMTSGSKTDGAKAFAAWHNQGLARKPAKRSSDHRPLAKAIIDIATPKPPDEDPAPKDHGKDGAAAARGRKGGRALANRPRSHTG